MLQVFKYVEDQKEQTILVIAIKLMLVKIIAIIII
jgi:hypothetical protein